MGDGLLEVTVLDPRDVAGAEEGGADRLLVRSATGMSPEPALVSAICHETDLPVHAVLRLNDTWTTTGGELARLAGLGEDYLGSGAVGFSFGFLDGQLEVDAEVCAYLSGLLPGVPWTFSRAIDDTLDPRRAWRLLLDLPELAAVRSAGSPRGLEVGFDDLLDTARDPLVARMLMPGGGLLAEQVPWFVRADVRQFHLGRQVRPGGSLKAYVDAGHVRSWRLLVDDALERAVRSVG
jgi:copper homeostasis protein